MSSETLSDAEPTGLPGHAFSSVFQAITGCATGARSSRCSAARSSACSPSGLLLAMAEGSGVFASLLASIVWIVAIGTGVNAAGLLQMDHARGISPRSTADALVYGLMCIPKLIVLALAFFAVEVAVFIVIALLLLLCKIPFLGPLLFVVVFPLSVVVVGVTIVGLFLCMLLSLPAIWQGASITRALGADAGDRSQPAVEARAAAPFSASSCFAVGLILFGVIGVGLMPTLGLSVSIVGFGGFGMESMVAMSQAGGGGYAIAGAIGGALLWAVAASLVGQVYLLGLSLVYLRVTEGLDLTASEAALTRDVRRRQAAHRRARREGAPGNPPRRSRRSGGIVGSGGRGRSRSRRACGLRFAASVHCGAATAVRSEHERSLPPRCPRAADAAAVWRSLGTRRRHFVAVR